MLRPEYPDLEAFAEITFGEIRNIRLVLEDWLKSNPQYAENLESIRRKLDTIYATLPFQEVSPH